MLSLKGEPDIPPMPIQMAEYVEVAEAETEGTAQEALTLVTRG